MKLTKWQIALTSICLITGLLLTVTLRAQERGKLNPTAQRSENLAGMVKNLQEENSVIENELVEIRSVLTKYQEARVYDQDDLAFLKQRLQLAQLEAGLVPVSGPGIVFTVDDRVEAFEQAGVSGEIRDISLFVVHDEWLRNIVNDLKNAGAEAISINGERIVTTSDIKCAGNFILVNTSELTNPYTIQAIGNPEILSRAITSGNTHFILTLNEYPITLAKKTEVQIPAYKSSFNLKFASIVTDEKGGK